MAILSYPFNSSESSCSRNSRVEKDQKNRMRVLFYFRSDVVVAFCGKRFLDDLFMDMDLDGVFSVASHRSHF